jgi:hypothetical protein
VQIRTSTGKRHPLTRYDTSSALKTCCTGTCYLYGALHIAYADMLPGLDFLSSHTTAHPAASGAFDDTIMSLIHLPIRRALRCSSYHRHHHRVECFSTLLSDAVVHKRGDPGYGSREYLLLPANATLEQVKVEPKVSIASLFAHKNIIFGARVHHSSFEIVPACTPLLQAALQDAAIVGEQPQAMASLTGLSRFVRSCFDQDEIILKEMDVVTLEACKAMATGIPRPGHSVVGVGTYRDGQIGWEIFAREFVKRNLSQEANLYKSKGAEVVGIEHLADKSEAYLKAAGGAMCRLFFV